MLSRPIDLVSHAADASMYRLIPRVVVRPADRTEMQALFAWARRGRRRLTFRAAGTSLSGQSVTDDVLVEVASSFRGAARVLEGGARVCAEPGVIGAHLNRLLAPHGRRLGPDPASIDAATIGGVLANNASGMCCGVAQNSYHTLDALTMVLADGTLVDTAQPDAEEELRRARPELCAEILALRDGLRRDTALAARIRRKFARKTTSGLSLNAFLDHDRPAAILARLMVGSEGTLGFVAEVTLLSVADPPCRSTALVAFRDLSAAGDAVAPLAAAGCDAVEILDSASLRAIASDHPLPFEVEQESAALLVELARGDDASLASATDAVAAILARYRLFEPPRFTREAAERDALWKLRKGLGPRMGARRQPGTAYLNEDIAVPVERLAEAMRDFQALFAAHGIESVLYGHAKDGNLHFALAEDVRRAEAVARYGSFLRQLVDLVVHKYDGTIKAEHGSGRNMAPFVRTEWGVAAYEAMRQVKRLLDPDGILNPDVVLSEDPDIHLRNLKPSPQVSATVDRCTECGLCEPHCPSRDLTLTPRRRIVVSRELALLAAEGAAARDEAAAIEADVAHEVLATCARDSLCAKACPIGIDTGAFVKERLAAALTPRAEVAAAHAARHFVWTARGARAALATAAVLRRSSLGRGLVSAASSWLHAAAPSLLPRIGAELAVPRPAPPLAIPGEAARERAVVYFPSCLTRIVGDLDGERTVPTARAMLDVLDWAGFAVRLPRGVDGLCCGMSFASKGYAEAARIAAARTAEALWLSSEEGALAVVTDASPCAKTLGDLVAAALAARGRHLRLLDFASFWAGDVLRGGGMPRRQGCAILHPTCSLVTSGGLDSATAVARAHAESLYVPQAAACCGFAGDRGFLVPELTERATADEAAEVRRVLDADPHAGCFSTCRTCEIGMTRAVGRPFRSLLHLVHEAVFGVR